jgi:acyl carrier protein
MIEQAEISRQLREFILANFPAARRQALDEENSLFNTHIVDSMGILDLALYIENAFGLTLKEEEFSAENFESIGALTKFVANKLTDR